MGGAEYRKRRANEDEAAATIQGTFGLHRGTVNADAATVQAAYHNGNVSTTEPASADASKELDASSEQVASHTGSCQAYAPAAQASAVPISNDNAKDAAAATVQAAFNLIAPPDASAVQEEPLVRVKLEVEDNA